MAGYEGFGSSTEKHEGLRDSIGQTISDVSSWMWKICQERLVQSKLFAVNDMRDTSASAR